VKGIPADEHSRTALKTTPSLPKRRVLALRDIRDVAAYVVGILDETGLPVNDQELRELVAFGVESVYRVELALPPERRLAPVIDGLLPSRLADGWRSLQLRTGLEPATAAG
jgi:hypothetical protein